MTTTALHSRPASGTVAKEQFNSVGLALKTEAMFFIGALILFAVLVIYSLIRNMHVSPDHIHDNAIRYGVGAAFPLFALALLTPFGVWRSEEPSRRAYHWSMPANRGPHTLGKFVSGWVWLMIATIIYLLFIVALSWTVSTISGQPANISNAPAWEWAIAFTAPTLAYALISVPVIASEHSVRWIVGIIIGYLLLSGVARTLGYVQISDWVRSIWAGWYGLKSGLFAIGGGKPSWLAAMSLWTIGAVIAVIIASYRHRE